MKRIGKYEIVSEIGRGGFGRVYKAIDPSMSRYVAVKVLELLDQPDMLVRFRNEAAAGGNLKHRNITTIHDFGDHEGVPYIVMEFLDGQDLDQLLGGGKPLPLAQRLDILIQAAEGLHCAHQNGIVHRDVKPANIMVLNDGTVKLMDFGIARITQGSASVHTRTGVLVGTVRYMAPEQFEGLSPDQRVDIWAWGVIGWELFSGEHPFDADDPANVMYRITTADLSEQEVDWRDCPAGLSAVIKHAVCRQRAKRIASFEDVLFELKPFQRELQRMRASQVITEARVKLTSGQTQEAQRLLRHVLELDADHPELSELRSRVQAELGKKRTFEEVNELVVRADQAYAARNFEEAISCLESAQQMAPDQSAIRSRLEVARAVQQRLQRSRSLVDEAKRALSARNFSGAFQFASEACQADPANDEAQSMMSSVQEKLKLRQVDEEIEAGLERARGLLAVHEFDEAIQIVEGLGRDHGMRTELQQLLDHARTERGEAQTRQGIERILDSASEALGAEQPGKAMELLEELTRRFPAAYPKAEPLLLKARQRVQDQERAAGVSQFLAEASALVAEERFEKAQQALKKGLLRWPDDADLSRALDGINQAKLERDRARLIQKALEKGQQLRKRGKLQEAIEYLDRVGPELGNATELRALRQAVAQEHEERAAFASTSRSRAEVAPLEPPSPPLGDTATRMLQTPAPAPAATPVITESFQRPLAAAAPGGEGGLRSKKWLWLAVAGAAVASLVAWLGLRETKEPAPATQVRLVAPSAPLRFRFDAAAAPVLSQTLKLEAEGGSAGVVIESGTPGIEANPRSANAPGEVEVRAYRNRFEPGPHQATLLVRGAGQEVRYAIEVIVDEVAASGRIKPTGEVERKSLLLDPRSVRWEGARGMALPASDVKLTGSSGRIPFKVSISAGGSEWLAASPSAGTSPSTIRLALRKWLAPGRYDTEVRLVPGTPGTDAGSLRVELLVSAPPTTQSAVEQPSATPPPKTEQASTQTAATRPPATPALYGGRMSGRLIWTGSLGPGESIAVNRDGLVSGPGSATGSGPPSVVPTQVVDLSPPEARYTVSPFENNPAGRIEIRNAGASAISLIQLRWRVNLP